MSLDTRTAVESIVMRTLAISHFPATFSSDAPIATLGVDSIMLLEIIVGLEAELGIVIADEALNDLLLSSVNGLVLLVESQRAGATDG